MKLSDDELREMVEAVRTYGGVRPAARALGIAPSTLRERMEAATRRNVTGEFMGGALPEGYQMGRVTSLVTPDGTRLEWQRKEPTVEALQSYLDDLIDLANQNIVPLPPLVNLGQTHDDLLTLYPIVDVHLGQYSWKKESGENYDLDIARDQFLSSTTSLMQMTPHSGMALIVVLGDYYHADNNRAETEKSHNRLDVDGRHDKVLHTGAELAIWEIDMALQKHENVVVKIMRGNHDPNSSKALAMTLYFRYMDNPRVTVDRSPEDLWVYQWGVSMLGFTHGDNVKAEDMPGVMAAHYPRMWGETKQRYAFSGHFHRRKAGPLSDEKHGAEWEILPAFTAKDAWNRSMGHASKRSIQAITFHKEKGRQFTTYVSL